MSQTEQAVGRCQAVVVSDTAYIKEIITHVGLIRKVIVICNLNKYLSESKIINEFR